MGKTLAEKILSYCTDEEVKAGSIITANVNTAMMDDILGPRYVGEEIEKYNARIKDPSKVVIISDHYTPSGTIQQADIVVLTREWAKEKKVDNYYEGIGPCHQILAENGYSIPGTVQVGTDSHTCTGGAFACFGTGIGSTEMAAVLMTGKIWFRVPESIKVTWDGKLSKGIMAKDVVLKTIGDIGHAGATYQSLEFGGSTISMMEMDERMCISNMAIEAGAKVGLIPSDDITKTYLESIGHGDKFKEIYPDEDAVYVNEISYKAEELISQIALPHEVDNVHGIDRVKGTRMHRAYIGSCTGGRLNDLIMAAKVLDGRKVSKDCKLLVSPASQNIWNKAAEMGILSKLANAGATILAPTCGACLGVHSGLLGKGENCVSATNRNFKGRMGSKESFVYLASPATIAASAIEGRLADVREYL